MSEVRHNPSRDLPRGIDLLRDPALNKGSAFTEAERDTLGLRGLLPPYVTTIEQQVEQVLETFRRRATPLEQYMDMVALQARNETLYYRVLAEHPDELFPIVYTPTVGEACQKLGHLPQRPRGVFITPEDRGRVAEVLRNWPADDVRVIVVTDGERILGLGDQGANGMGIPVGKLALYTACAGVNPGQCLPVVLDAGTDNRLLLDDPLYVGRKAPRLRGRDYDTLVDEFIHAAVEIFPKVLVQFEDFGNANAFRLLERYRDRVCTFNDDIQGTGAVVLAGLYAAPRIAGGTFAEQTFLFLGAGEAGIGIAEMIVGALLEEGLSEDEARRRCWFVDSKGMVVAGRTDLPEHKRRFAHEHPPAADFLAAVEALKPTTIIGASGQTGAFTRPVLEAMARINQRPVVMALSNPTSKAECTAEQAYEWTEGRAVFASGSPFAPVTWQGRTFVPGQGNNAYIFPAVGLGVIASEARRVTDQMFAAAAKALAARVEESDLALGRIYPPLTKIKEVSAYIAAAVCEVAYSKGLTAKARPDDVLSDVRARMYVPEYRTYV